MYISSKDDSWPIKLPYTGIAHLIRSRGMKSNSITNRVLSVVDC